MIAFTSEQIAMGLFAGLLIIAGLVMLVGYVSLWWDDRRDARR